MKRTLLTSLLVSALSIPAVSFAQVNAPVTRAQVRAELVELQQAGYKSNTSDSAYPQDVQDAEQRVEARHGAAPQVGTSSPDANDVATVGSSALRRDDSNLPALS
jgi:Domain of unknown function (DUF4148)